MVATRDQWNNMTPEEKIEVLREDAADLRGKIGDISRRIDNIVAAADKNFGNMASDITGLKDRIAALEPPQNTEQPSTET